jgi:GNAT superfamily N-acetyltransferase
MDRPIALHSLDKDNPTQHSQIAAIWSKACGDELAISAKGVAYSLRPAAMQRQVGWLAYADGEVIGFVIASQISGDPLVAPPTRGYIDAIAVDPSHQKQGIGARLISTAEQWLVAQNCRQLVLGSSLHHLVPGLPDSTGSLDFFLQRDFQHLSPDGVTPAAVWDLSADLASYTPPATMHEVAGAVRPAQQHDLAAFLKFMEREFPGRWHYKVATFSHERQRLSDYMLLWTERGVDGFCQLCFEDSQRPMELYYPYRLPRPWGQLGPIGVSADLRGQGFGSALLDASLRRLHNNGINGCLIDWTEHLDFYAKFGFSPYRRYLRLGKTLLA